MGPEIARLVAQGKVHCPFCAAVLANRSGELYCDAGRCGFAERVTEEFADGLAKANLAAPKFGGHSGRRAGSSRCPGCTTPLKLRPPHLVCTNCGFSCAGSMHFVLTERHAHAR